MNQIDNENTACDGSCQTFGRNDGKSVTKMLHPRQRQKKLKNVSVDDKQNTYSI